MKSQRLDEWFFALAGPRIDYLRWSVEDCGLARDPPGEWPYCLRGEATWRQDWAVVVITIDIRVATRAGLANDPTVFAVAVRTVARVGASDAESKAIFRMWNGKQLSEIRGFLEAASIQARAQPTGVKR
jgi:hypothetical protein